ncbi:hypothetical protein FRX31_032116 [Thalictrum thalictroides]|uniref:Uncharacterized protein n=1 Tax=Thalictrum thalictroides TaxID=46969 RepID=A0A7J6V042_THATH|nr:hypothetical protein FRX31_032116 [Thalictrum thalictroides]
MSLSYSGQSHSLATLAHRSNPYLLDCSPSLIHHPRMCVGLAASNDLGHQHKLVRLAKASSPYNEKWLGNFYTL